VQRTESVTTVGRHYVSSYMYFCCRIRQEVLLYDAERDQLAIAKFLFILYSSSARIAT